MFNKALSLARNRMVKNIASVPVRFSSLPVNYNNVKLHSPYDDYKNATANIMYGTDLAMSDAEFDRCFEMAIQNLPADMAALRATITDKRELDLFDNVFAPSLMPHTHFPSSTGTMKLPNSISRRNPFKAYYFKDRVSAIYTIVTVISAIYMVDLVMSAFGDYFRGIIHDDEVAMAAEDAEEEE